jgi:hypothetical protein
MTWCRIRMRLVDEVGNAGFGSQRSGTGTVRVRKGKDVYWGIVRTRATGRNNEFVV